MMLYQFFHVPDQSLHKYLSPKDLFQLYLSTKWLQSFVREERKFTRDLYWHYYGPPLAAFRIKTHSYLNLHSKQDYIYFMHDVLRTLQIDDVLLRQDPTSRTRSKVVSDELISQAWRDAINEFVNSQIKSADSNDKPNVSVLSRNAQDEVSSLLTPVVHTVVQNVDAVDAAALQAKFGHIEMTPYRHDALAHYGHLFLIENFIAARVQIGFETVVKLEDFFRFKMSQKSRTLFIDYLWNECQNMSWSVFSGYTVYLRHYNQLPDPIYSRLCTRYLKLSFINFSYWKFREINVDNIIFNDIKRAIDLYKVNAQSHVEAFCRYAVYNLPKDYSLLNKIVNSSDLVRKNAIWIMTQFEDEKDHAKLFDFMLGQIGALTLDEYVYAFSSVLNAQSVVDDVQRAQNKQKQESSSLNSNSQLSKASNELLGQVYGRITCMIEKLGGFDMVHSFLKSFKIEQISTQSARLLSRLLIDLNCRDAYADVDQIAVHVALQYINRHEDILVVLLQSYLADGVPFASSVAAVKQQLSTEKQQALCKDMTLEIWTRLGFEQQQYDSFLHQLTAAINGPDENQLSEMARILKLVYDCNDSLDLSRDARYACQQLLMQILSSNTSHSLIFKALPAKAYQEKLWHLLYLEVLIKMNYRSSEKLQSEIQSLWSVMDERVSGIKSDRGSEIYYFKCALLDVSSLFSKDITIMKIIQEFQEVVEYAQFAQQQ
ncbi:hypothetical protein MP228_001126 [Amoeboaphelidium protococcarum]|nr:hypothetical protein MP228_001126 [Amoeboaphelidium protococcarum]